MVYELPKKPVQLIGVFVLYMNEFHLLAEIIPCHKAEAFGTLQIEACNFYAKTWHYHQNYTCILFAS